METFKFPSNQRFTMSINGLPILLTRHGICFGGPFIDNSIADAMVSALNALERMHEDGATGLTGEWNGFKITIEVVNGK